MNYKKLLISLLLPQFAGIIGSFFTVSAIATWYVGLQKPVFSPPNWLFGPAWVTLYFLMGLSVYIIWSKVDSFQQIRGVKLALWIFWVHLFFNAVWSIIFFGMRNPALAFADIIIIWIFIVILIVKFWNIRKTAAYLLIPYLLWVSFASVLNYSLWQLNKGIDGIVITNFNECVEAGNAVMESYPRQCRVANGGVFTEYIGNELEKMDLIKINYPRSNQAIKSPLTISGEARGFWFFEADFPVILTNWDGLIIGEGIAQAKGDWMTEDFVPFEAVIEFEKPDYKNNGSLILKKDNPSGLPEYDDALEIPVLFE
jgi:translocator protein